MQRIYFPGIEVYKYVNKLSTQYLNDLSCPEELA